MVRIYLSVLLLIFVSFSISAQNDAAVCGKVTAFNKYGIKGVKVFAKKSGASTNTDEKGNYCVIVKNKDKITIKAQGFESAYKKVDSDSFNVNLIFRTSNKNIDLAVGYGYMKKEDLLYAVNNLSEENNNFAQFSDIFNLIKGRFPGVTIRNEASGSPIVVVRGGAASGDVSALYIVDGIATDNIASISPNDVSTIDVMKDGGAAIYGTRASNGVVLITTKKK